LSCDLEPIDLVRQRAGERRPPAVLAITSEPPWPLDTGGHLRTFHLIRALSRRFRVRLVVPVEPRQGGLDLEGALRGIDLVAVDVPPRSRVREGLRAVSAMARGEPYVMYRRHDRQEVRRTLAALAKREPVDLLYLDHLDSFVYRGIFPDVPAVVDLHNVYSTLVGRAAADRTDVASGMYLRHEASRLAAVERRVARSGDTLMVVSEDDGQAFSAQGASSVCVVPNGVDCTAYASSPAGRGGAEPIILFIGALSWGPNVSAARVLATQILPEVRASIPEARLRLVGRDPAPEVCGLARLPGIELFASVPDVRPHLEAASLLAVPLAAGGGTRLKILEAFAAGLPVVSTPIGCEGLAVDPGVHLVVADLERMPGAIVALLGEQERGIRLAQDARRLAQSMYDWSVVGSLACCAVDHALARRVH
jgi:glycosyltransferase involved in cell wall biosynthesis